MKKDMSGYELNRFLLAQARKAIGQEAAIHLAWMAGYISRDSERDDMGKEIVDNGNNPNSFSRPRGG